MSTLPERMGNPTARTSLTGEFTKREHNVEIVNHEVEDDINVERSRREYAEAVNFKKHRTRDYGKSGAYGGIEALKVSDLHDAAIFLGQADEFVGFPQRGRQGFFDQHIDPSLHQLACGTQMMNCGHRHRCRLNFTVGGGELLDRTKAVAAKFAPHRVRLGCISINYTDQPYRSALLGELVVNASVVAAKGAHPDHSDIDKVIGGQCSVPGRAKIC